VTQRNEDETAETPHGVFDADTILGMRIVRDPDPAAKAERLAVELHGELVRDAEHAQRAFAARAEAGRAEPVVLSDSERAELAARAATAVGDDSPAMSDWAISELRQLAAELGMTERIRSNTEARFVETLNRRLSAASTVAVHPTAIRQAATAVTDAEAAVADCDASVAELGPRPTTEPEAGSSAVVAPHDDLDDVPDLFDEERLERNRRSGWLSIVVVVLSAAAAGGLLSIGAPVWVPPVVFGVGLVLAIVLRLRNRTGHSVDHEGRREASELLASTSAQVELSAPVRNDDAEEEWLGRRAQLDAAKESAVERLRSARRHWESLVGPGADPHDVESLLRVRDPQLELVGAASKTSPTVRTVSAVHRSVQARWTVAWATVGYDEPPPPAKIDEHLDLLESLHGEGGAEAARSRLAAARVWSDACATIDRPIVLVSPDAWLPPDELESMAGGLPAGAEVVIVQRGAAAS
jgi:hypothetical protein